MDNQKKLFKILCLALITVHAVWVCIHMYYHSQDYLNPWKLGGYAMYTQPSPWYWGSAESATRPDDVSKIRYDYFNYYARGGCLSGINSDFYDTIINGSLYNNFDPKESIKLTFNVDKFSFEKLEFVEKKSWTRIHYKYVRGQKAN